MVRLRLAATAALSMLVSCTFGGHGTVAGAGKVPAPKGSVGAEEAPRSVGTDQTTAPTNQTSSSTIRPATSTSRSATTSTTRAARPAPSAADIDRTAARDLLSAIRRTLLTPEGGVRSYYLDGTQEDPEMAGVGHERLSESTALLLSYAEQAGDADLFRLVHSYYVTHQRSETGLAYWKLDKNDAPVSSDGSYSSAPIEEIRIAGALRGAATKFGRPSYGDDASLVARALVAAVRHGVLTDNVSWGQSPPEASSSVEIGYLDIRGMRTLSAAVKSWGAVADDSLKVLQGAVVDGAPPWQRYDLGTGQYSCPDRCGTTPGLWSALNLLGAGDVSGARRVAAYYLGKMSHDGRLWNEYTPQGEGSHTEELSSYALLVRLLNGLGDRAAAETVMRDRIVPQRVQSGPLTGLFSYVEGDAPAFDNLEILLALEDLAGTA